MNNVRSSIQFLTLDVTIITANLAVPTGTTTMPGDILHLGPLFSNLI